MYRFLFIAGLVFVSAGCSDTAQKNWGMGTTVCEAYQVAQDAYAEEANNASCSTFMNMTVNGVGDKIADRKELGLANMTFKSAEAATTMVKIELGPLANLGLVENLVTAMDMSLKNSSVVVVDGELQVLPLPVAYMTPTK